MGITKTISLTNWHDVIAGKTGNPLAEEAIRSLASAGELLVEDEGSLHVPTQSDGAWELAPVLTEHDVSEWLGVPPGETHRLLVESGAPTCGVKVGLFGSDGLWRRAEVSDALMKLAATKGMPERDAALELGLTLDSYGRLADSIPFTSQGRALKAVLEAFQRKHLPKNKIWSTRTSLVREFAANFSRAHPEGPPLQVQLCDVDGCGHVASDQCCNRACRAAQASRYVCPAHAQWVDVAEAVRRPPSLCPTCADAVRTGRLGGFRLL